MRRDAPARQRRGFGNRLPERFRTPLRTIWRVLHVKHRAAERGRHGIHTRQLILDRHHGLGEEAPFNLRPHRRFKAGEKLVMRAIDQRIAIAHANTESDPHANITRGARDLFGFGHVIRKPHGAHMMDHDSALAAKRGARQRCKSCQIRINRRHHGQPMQPGFQWFAKATH